MGGRRGICGGCSGGWGSNGRRGGRAILTLLAPPGRVAGGLCILGNPVRGDLWLRWRLF